VPLYRGPRNDRVTGAAAFHGVVGLETGEVRSLFKSLFRLQEFVLPRDVVPNAAGEETEVISDDAPATFEWDFHLTHLD
jgi:hypothetical protein